MLQIPLVFKFTIIILFAIECNSTNNSVYMLGYSVVNEEARKITFFDARYHIYVPEGARIKIRAFGKFTAHNYLMLSPNRNCNKKGSSAEKELVILGNNGTAAETVLIFPTAAHAHASVYFCLREQTSATSVLQGGYFTPDGKHHVSEWLTVKLLKRDNSFPLWFYICAVIVLLLLSALFSGLNLGLLSLDKTDLKVIINTGSKKERTEALKIAPVRNHGNFLLCSLLFSNVLVNTILTLLMDQMFGSDWKTVVVTTLSIVVVGEILPQAVCSRYGLTVGAKTIWITKFFMTLSFPLAYPVGKLLDKLLGEEIGAVYTRDRLKELLKVTRDQHGLESEEMEIISGTLDMKTKTVKEVMTPLDNIFMLSTQSILNVDLLVSIEDSGYTRIPVYEKERWNVTGVLNVKNLCLYDPHQNMPLSRQMEHNKSHLFFVFENTRLDYMLKIFREGSRGHIAFVQRINDEGPGDPKYETIGLVTLEDVLEELLQVEIYDENDVDRLQAKSEAKPIPLPLVHYANATNRMSVARRGAH